jgi:hypothetical protein
MKRGAEGAARNLSCEEERSANAGLFPWVVNGDGFSALRDG